jgi:hypothetical protein
LNLRDNSLVCYGRGPREGLAVREPTKRAGRGEENGSVFVEDLQLAAVHIDEPSLPTMSRQRIRRDDFIVFFYPWQTCSGVWLHAPQ